MSVCAPSHRPQRSLVPEALDRNDHQLAAFRLFAHAHQRNKCYAQVHSHKSLYRLDRGYLDRNVKRGLKPAKGLDHLLAGGGANVVADKGLCAEVPDVNSLSTREPMSWAHYECKLIPHDGRRFEIGFIGQKGKDGEIQIALVKLVRKPRRELARDFDLNLRILLAKFEDQLRQQVKTGALVGANANAAALKGVELFERGEAFITQVEQALGVFVKHLTRIGQHIIAAVRSIEQRRAKLLFQLAYRHRQRGLSAENAVGRFAKASLFHHRHEHFELHQLHLVLASSTGRDATRL